MTHRLPRFLLAGVSALVLIASSPLLAAGTVTAAKAAVSTASPIATKTGLSVLQSGGNAADAAVAIAMTLAVSQPQAGNLGGGGFLLYFDASTSGVWTLDFRETAPRAAKREPFAKSASVAQDGALAAGTPGTVAGLEALHQKFGTKSWEELVAPAAALAREGFVPEPQLVSAIDRSLGRIAQFGTTAALYLENGKPRSRIAHAELASVLDRVAVRGAREFYEGETAKRLVDSVKAAGGILSDRDLREYRPVWRAPIRIRHGRYDLYAPPPPSSGGLVIGATLGILASDDFASMPFQSPAALHLQVEALRRAFIDRNRYLADPSATRIPYRALLSKGRAEQWRQTIDPARAIATVNLTEPVKLEPEGDHTTHFSVVDESGNVASFTTTLGADFGNAFVLPGLGFPLNDAMDGFTTLLARPNREGLVQGGHNQVDPSQRPASSLSPAIVTRDGKPYLVIGAAGGAAIPSVIAQIFLALTERKTAIAEAVEAARFHQQAIPDQVEYERGRTPQQTLDALSAMGHGLSGREAIGEVYAIQIEPGRLTAVADPRGGGAAGGY